MWLMFDGNGKLVGKYTSPMDYSVCDCVLFLFFLVLSLSILIHTDT